MKITCPHCKRAMSFADEKLREYLGDNNSLEDESNHPVRQTWIMIIIVAAALCGTVGFGGGALLTSPSRNRTEARIADAQTTAAKQVQQATQDLKRATQETDKVSHELWTANTRIAQLQAMAKKSTTRIAALQKQAREAGMYARIARAEADKEMVVKNKPATPKNQPVDSAPRKSIDAAIATLLRTGAVHSVNVEFNQARIDPFLWAGLTLEVKQNTVMLLSKYFESKGRTGRVTILSNRNDTKLATYGAWGGIKILQ